MTERSSESGVLLEKLEEKTRENSRHGFSGTEKNGLDGASLRERPPLWARLTAADEPSDGRRRAD